MERESNMYARNALRTFVRAIFGMSALLLAFSAQAAVIFQFGPQIDGPGNPLQPAARLTITQSGADTVSLFLENLATSGDQFVKQLALNVSPYPISGRGGSFSSPVTGISWQQDKLNTGRMFDVEIEFTSSGGLRLGPGMSTTFTLTGTGLLESHFLTTSPGHPDTYALVHINSTPNGDSAKLIAEVVPEPATLGAAAIGVLGLLARRKRRA
jgi:hypothetical protein